MVRGEVAINAVGVPTPGRVLIAGGGVRSPAYRQILADLTGREVVGAAADEATARGAAIQAAAVATGADIAAVATAWAPPSSVVAQPRPGSAAVRSELMERYAVATDWSAFDGTIRPAGTRA